MRVEAMLPKQFHKKDEHAIALFEHQVTTCVTFLGDSRKYHSLLEKFRLGVFSLCHTLLLLTVIPRECLV